MRRREQGAALILVLAAVAILTALAVEFAALASTDSLRAARSSRGASFRRLHDSGSESARGLLVELAPEKFTTWGQEWNREIRFALSPNETAVVRLADESGKLNLARIWIHPDDRSSVLRRAARMFDYLRRHDLARAKEWRAIEAAAMKRLQSTEPLMTLDGFREATLSIEQVFGPAGLARYFTCFGDGTVNVNTAPSAVLYALDEEFDDEIAQRIADFRGKGEGEPGTYKAFREPKDLVLVDGMVVRAIVGGELRIVRNHYERVQSLISVKSACISARITAQVDGRAREAWSFLKPDGSRVAFEEIQP